MRTALVLLCLSASMARADVACREADPATKITATFASTVSLHDLSGWVLGFTCKNIVFAPEVAKHAQQMTILAPKPMSPKQALQLFVDAVQATGLVVQVKPDTILIKQGPGMPRSCPDLAVATPTPTPTPTTTPPPAVEDPDIAKLVATIKQLDATHYEIPKATVDAILANPMEVMKGARAVPSVTAGKPDGIKLYAIRPSSLFAKLGLVNGDTVVTVNKLALTDAEKGLEVYMKLREARQLDVAILRRGVPLTLVWTIK